MPQLVHPNLSPLGPVLGFLIFAFRVVDSSLLLFPLELVAAAKGTGDEDSEEETGEFEVGEGETEEGAIRPPAG